MSLRLKAIIAAALAVAGFGGWLILRDSALFSVDRVTIVGLSRGALPAVREEIRTAARAQTTTDFSVGAVRAAVAQYSLIETIHARTHVPHGVTIEVTERHPVARLAVSHERIALDATGGVITGLRHAPALAVLRSHRLPVGGRTRDPFVLLALRVLGDAPAPLRRRVVAITLAHGALTIHLHRGPRLIFGSATLPHAKWDAAAAVLADASSRGATYVDVQLPSRPAAQVGDPATASTASAGEPAGSSTLATVLSPALAQPSVST